MSMPSLMGVVHVHSTYSHDGSDDLPALRRFALDRHLAFVGLTDHAEDLDEALYRRYMAECAELSDNAVRLIPGLEFRFAGLPGLHLLALGLRQWIEPKTPAEFITSSEPVAGFTILAHPVLTGYRVPTDVAEGINGVEVWNASYNTRYLPDPAAIALLHRIRRSRPDVVGVAGLDQHDSSNDRGTRVVLSQGGAVDPLEELRAGRFLNRGRTMEFDSGVRMGRVRFGLLRQGRRLLDVANRMHDRVVRLRRNWT